MFITEVEATDEHGNPGRVLDCVELGDVHEIIFCEGEIWLIRPNGNRICIITEDFGSCPRCGVTVDGPEEHTCVNPLFDNVSSPERSG